MFVFCIGNRSPPITLALLTMPSLYYLHSDLESSVAPNSLHWPKRPDYVFPSLTSLLNPIHPPGPSSPIHLFKLLALSFAICMHTVLFIVCRPWKDDLGRMIPRIFIDTLSCRTVHHVMLGCLRLLLYYTRI